MDKSSITNICSKASISIIIFSLFIGFTTAVCMPCLSASNPTLYIDPSLYQSTHLNETFQINVRISDVASSLKLVGAEFKLQYNNTLLETQEEWIGEGDFFKSFGETYSEGYVFTDDQGVKYILAFVLLLPSDIGVYSEFPDGDGTLATISFNTTYRPVQPTQASCELKLYDVVLVDVDLNTVTPTERNGLYHIASISWPTLEISPKEHVALRNGETFEVRVNIKELDRDWHLTGLQFKLRYNTTLLETKPEWIGEGDFFKTYGSTWFQALVENDYGIVGILILPDEAGEYNGPFPEGEGTVATLKFRTTYQPVEPENSSSSLILDDTVLVNDKTETIPHNTINGECVILAGSATVDQYRPIDVQLDVGNIHFNGEVADFYALVTDYGKVVDPDSINAMLYFEGAEYLNLTNKINKVSTGLYRIPHTISADAQTGTYLLLVLAEYAHVAGTAIKSFLVSSTLDNWNSSISDIKDNIATVLIPSVGQIKMDLTALNATLLSIDDKVATIGTSVGNLTTDLANLDIKITKVDGDIATVQTNLGTIQTKVSDLQGNVQTSINLLYVVVILTLIAAITGAIAALDTLKKKSAGSQKS